MPSFFTDSDDCSDDDDHDNGSNDDYDSDSRGSCERCYINGRSE